MGLTICKNIVEKYNGKIWFESEENVGTKFYVSIPAQAA
ncbi:MAG: ATP-binding protein [Saprospiraceae bacterium]|nr:ATP-binding protein [Saprospiraceae bacterium]